jgi:hypothetical protein
VRLAPAFVAALTAFTATSAAAAGLDMLGFFTGKSHGENVMKIALQRPKKLIVDSVGGRNKEGEFILIDTVQEEGKPPRKRTWAMREAGPNHYTGTLSDAVGPVDVVINGDTATVRYTMKDGHLKVEQQLKLQPGGKTIANRVVAKKFGMKFATVEGIIRKLD